MLQGGSGQQLCLPGCELVPGDLVPELLPFLPGLVDSHWLGRGFEATRLQGAAPLAPEKQKIRGPGGSYLAKRGHTSSLPQLCRFF